MSDTLETIRNEIRIELGASNIENVHVRKLALDAAMRAVEPFLTTHRADAIEHALWKDLAAALNRLSEYGLDVVAGMCEQLGAKPTATVDAGEVIHGGGVREPGDGYLLRYVPPFTPDPDQPGHNLPFGWQVTERPA